MRESQKGSSKLEVQSSKFKVQTKESAEKFKARSSKFKQRNQIQTAKLSDSWVHMVHLFELWSLFELWILNFELPRALRFPRVLCLSCDTGDD
jgi:hypothetical protein